MNNRNRFLLNLHFNSGFRDFEPENKTKIIEKVLSDPDIMSILNSVEEEEIEEIEEIDVFSFTESNILLKQIEVEKYYETIKSSRKNRKINENKKYDNVPRGKYGRTELHELVLLSRLNKQNLKRLKELLEKEDYLFAKDNNGQNAYQLALLEENRKIIEIMKPYFKEKEM